MYRMVRVDETMMANRGEMNPRMVQYQVKPRCRLDSQSGAHLKYIAYSMIANPLASMSLTYVKPEVSGT